MYSSARAWLTSPGNHGNVQFSKGLEQWFVVPVPVHAVDDGWYDGGHLVEGGRPLLDQLQEDLQHTIVINYCEIIYQYSKKNFLHSNGHSHKEDNTIFYIPIVKVIRKTNDFILYSNGQSHKKKKTSFFTFQWLRS